MTHCKYSINILYWREALKETGIVVNQEGTVAGRCGRISGITYWLEALGQIT